MGGWPSMAALVEECTRPGLPGIVPSELFSLAAIPELVLAELAASRRGVVVLGVDGLSHEVAARCWDSARLRCLTSTFPSTSAPAWLTALTGAGPREHGVPGMVYRVGESMVYAVTGEGIGGTREVPAGAVLPRTTVFERAAAAGARCVALGRELYHLPGQWAPALLRGASPAGAAPSPDELAAQAADPQRLVDAVTADVAAVGGDAAGGGGAAGGRAAGGGAAGGRAAGGGAAGGDGATGGGGAGVAGTAELGGSAGGRVLLWV
ncbi:MAG TPA: alkaline phosphatase family protein, partial [Actinoplanes sp.]|nr:alkaline phosphatase family protein [Actinoplanes sp.]